MSAPILVTGATGAVGFAIVNLLVDRGARVRVLVRDEKRAKAVLDPSVDCVVGDVTDASSLERAVSGAKTVFHAAGMPEQWVRDEAIFDRVNADGTANLLAACLRARIDRFVYTSTMDMFDAEPSGTLSEGRPAVGEKPTAYERSKAKAELHVFEAAKQGLSTVHLNPSAVYGPSPSCSAMNKFIVDVVKRKVPLLPPFGISIVHSRGVAEAHLAAREQGPDGSRYLLSDAYVSYRDLAIKAAACVGRSEVPPSAPLWLIKGLVGVTVPFGRWFGLRPPMSRGELTFLQWDVRVDASKAQRELNFRPTDVDAGIAETVKWFERL